MSLVGMASAMRTGMSGRRFATAHSISRATWGELLDFSLKMMRTARLASMAATMLPPHWEPAAMSRGAIQHLIPAPSSAWQIMSAAAWSRVE